MADNTVLNAGASGDTIATDDIGGVKWQRVKISTGPDGSATDVDVGNGTAAASLRVTLANDSTGIVNTQLGKAEDSAHVSGDTVVPAGVVRNDTLAALAGTSGDYAIPQVNGSGALYVHSVAHTAGGSTPYFNDDVDETEDAIKATAGQLYWLHVMNLSASVVWLQVYDATTATVTVGTTAPALRFPIPTQGDTNGAGFTISFPEGTAFSTAITVAATTTRTGTAGPGANECIVNAGYK